MQYFTKEEFKRLKHIEDMLIKAAKSKTAVGFTDDIWCIVYPIYFRIFKHRMSSTCNYCKMKVLIAIGELYLKEIEDGGK